MSIYLIRHGKTHANERHLYCGSTDLSLSPTGADELLEKRYSIPADAVFVSSGMKRCNETLRLLFGDVSFDINPAFREIDFGIFEMKGYEELKDTPAYIQWISGDNISNIPPKGESGAHMSERVLKAYHTLTDHTVVVTHGGVIAAIMEHLFPTEGKNRYQWQPKPGCGYCITGKQYTSIE